MNSVHNKKIKIGIIGATGYTGQELLGILFRHPSVEIIFLSSESNSGQILNQIFPNLNSNIKFITLQEAKKFSGNEVDLVFFTTPNNIAVNEAKYFLDKNISVIDFSADFRLKTNEEYLKYYGFEHKNLELLKNALYGLVELHRDKIKALKKPFIIANPGCYTTAANLALIPVCFYEGDKFNLNSIIINGASGVSGAGKKLEASLSFNEANENFKAYNIAGKHRHTPEINMVLNEAIAGSKAKDVIASGEAKDVIASGEAKDVIASGEAAWQSKPRIKVSFTPHLIPMYRGLYTTSHIDTKNDFNIQDFYSYYSHFYKNDQFIKVLELGSLPETKWTNKNNNCFIGMDYDPETKRLIICSTIDNLNKGAAGQAVQNMNLAFGFAEEMGLV
jgi:N-acetyl-gamma-glutamyl-phosphate reductase